MFESKLEKSWAYREIIEKGKKEGIEESVNALRSVLIQVVEMRFPELLPLAREVAERSTVPAALSMKVNKLLKAQTSEEARQVLQES